MQFFSLLHFHLPDSIKVVAYWNRSSAVFFCEICLTFFDYSVSFFPFVPVTDTALRSTNEIAGSMQSMHRIVKNEQASQRAVRKVMKLFLLVWPFFLSRLEKEEEDEEVIIERRRRKREQLLSKLNQQAANSPKLEVSKPAALPNKVMEQVTRAYESLSREASPISSSKSNIDSLDGDLPMSDVVDDDWEAGLEDKLRLVDVKSLPGNDQDLASQLEKDGDWVKRTLKHSIAVPRLQPNVDMFADTDIFAENYQVKLSPVVTVDS